MSSIQANAVLPDFSPWEVVEKLGEGGQCAVFRVRHTEQPGVERAVKVMFDRSPNALDRFVAEAKLLMQIAHPNVIKVHALTADAERPWIVMDLLGGEDLDEERERGPFEPERAAQIIADVASGLSAVHRLGIRHRDIKPSNIMVGLDGVPRLIDFGIAREVDKAHLTQAGMVIGTIAYMAPEVFEDTDIATVQDSEAADVYALGQSLHEILVGEPVYPRDGSSTKLLAMVMRDKLARDCLDPREKRPQVPEELAAIVRDATRQQPERRIGSAKELERRLREWLTARSDLNTAPVSRFDPHKLPPPPGSKSSPPIKVPEVVAPPPPPARSGGGWGRTLLMWAASGVGTATLLALLGLGTVVGVGALWAWRPAHSTYDAAAVGAELDEKLVEQRQYIAECAMYLPSKVRAQEPLTYVYFYLQAGKPLEPVVEASALTDKRALDCLTDGVARMSFPGVPDAPVRVPIKLR